MAKGDNVTHLMNPQGSGPSSLPTSLGYANKALGLGKQLGLTGQPGSWTNSLGPALGAGTSLINLLHSQGGPNDYLQAAPGLIKGYGAITGSNAGGLLGPGLGQVGGSLAGDVLPGIGAATGAYNLAQNKSKSSDILSGAGTGASVGSMILPGIGTGIGAGIGALVGWGRHAFGGPDAIEQAGRGAETSITNQIASGATQAQKDEAAKAGWPDPNEALKHIMLRDSATKSGLSPQDAEASASKTQHAMWDAESNGSQAVSDAASPLKQMLSQGQPSVGAGVPWTGSLSNRPGSMITDAFSKGANG
jgi:hypothetical protein